MAHGDYTATEMKLLRKYPMKKTYGVTNLLKDIHELREKRFRGTDTTFLSCVLVDFERLLEDAGLTTRQKETLYYIFELDLTQEETAERMGVSQQAVKKLIDRAIAKIVNIARREADSDEDAF